MPEIKLKATIHKVTIDRDGEGTIVLKVPASDKVNVAKCFMLSGEDAVLDVEMNVEAK